MIGLQVLVEIVVMRDVPICLIFLFPNLRTSFVLKVLECYVLERRCEYRVYFVVNLVPNYGGDYYRGLSEKRKGIHERDHFPAYGFTCSL